MSSRLGHLEREPEEIGTRNDRSKCQFGGATSILCGVALNTFRRPFRLPIDTELMPVTFRPSVLLIECSFNPFDQESEAIMFPFARILNSCASSPSKRRRAGRMPASWTPADVELLEDRQLLTATTIDLVGINASKTVDSRAFFHVEQNTMRFGDTVSVDLAVTNQGSGTVSSGTAFDVNFVLLPNSSTAISQGVILGTATGLSVPKAGSTTFLSRFSLKLPDVAPFDGRGFTIAAVIDPQNKIAETNESNNSKHGAGSDLVDLTIDPKIPTGIDLKATDARQSQGARAYFHVEQSSVRFGDLISVDMGIANQGNLNAAPGTTMDVNFVLLPNSQTPISQGVVVGTASGISVPNAGSSAFLDRFQVKLPDIAPWMGSGFTLVAVIDPQNKLTELNETNNSGQGANLDLYDLTIGPKLIPSVDLTAVDASKTLGSRAYFHIEQSTVHFGDSVQVDLAVTNNGVGRAPANSTFDVNFVLLPNANTPVSQGVAVGTATGLSVPDAGATTFLDRFKVTLPDVQPFAGIGFTLAAVIDPQNHVVESNETNNSNQGSRADLFDFGVVPPTMSVSERSIDFGSEDFMGGTNGANLRVLTISNPDSSGSLILGPDAFQFSNDQFAILSAQMKGSDEILNIVTDPIILRQKNADVLQVTLMALGTAPGINTASLTINSNATAATTVSLTASVGATTLQGVTIPTIPGLQLDPTKIIIPDVFRLKLPNGKEVASGTLNDFLQQLRAQVGVITMPQYTGYVIAASGYQGTAEKTGDATLAYLRSKSAEATQLLNQTISNRQQAEATANAAESSARSTASQFGVDINSYLTDTWYQSITQSITDAVNESQTDLTSSDTMAETSAQLKAQTPTAPTEIIERRQGLIRSELATIESLSYKIQANVSLQLAATQKTSEFLMIQSSIQGSSDFSAKMNAAPTARTRVTNRFQARTTATIDPYKNVDFETGLGTAKYSLNSPPPNGSKLFQYDPSNQPQTGHAATMVYIGGQPMVAETLKDSKGSQLTAWQDFVYRTGDQSDKGWIGIVPLLHVTDQDLRQGTGYTILTHQSNGTANQSWSLGHDCVDDMEDMAINGFHDKSAQKILGNDGALETPAGVWHRLTGKPFAHGAGGPNVFKQIRDIPTLLAPLKNLLHLNSTQPSQTNLAMSQQSVDFQKIMNGLIAGNSSLASLSSFQNQAYGIPIYASDNWSAGMGTVNYVTFVSAVVIPGPF